MNAPQDLDRRLTEYLHDGPTRAPERAIAGALDHAQAHPRRRDPIAFIRRDPMASQGVGSGLQALALVAALGLLLVAVVAVASVGGLFERRPLVVPPTSPTPAVTVASSLPPTATPSGPPLPATFRVTLTVAAGNPVPVVVFDDSGTLVRVASGTPGDGGSVGDGLVQVVNDPADPRTLVLTWTGTPCDGEHSLNISADARTMTIGRPACQGDALPLDRVLRLTFDQPIPAASVNVTIATVG